MLITARRYLTTILGAFGVASFLAAALLVIGSSTVGSLVETSMRERGARFAALLLAENGNIDAFLTGVSRDPDAELKIRGVATVSNIESFAIFDPAGTEVYRSRSDRYKWLLRDRPGGITTGDRLSEKVLATPGDDWQTVNDDGTANPSVVVPLSRDGRRIAYVQVESDMDSDRVSYMKVLARTFLAVPLVVFVATSLPLLFYIRRQRQMAEADERIQFLANYDPLTRLLNRSFMHAEIDRVLATSRATREGMALYFVDIDGLSDINDAYGQAQGDTLLRAVADRITSVVDRSDLIARLGADDFAILQRRVNDKNDVADLTARLQEAIGQPVELGSHTIRPQISIGVALMPADGRSADDLVKHAELALFNHKSTRTGGCVLYQPFMDEEMHRRRLIETKIRLAVETDGFELWYQPIVNRDGSKLLGFETLIRLSDGEGDYISPAVFIPIAEARGYIKQIGTWVIRQAAHQAALWPDELVVAINLSPVQFRDGDLIEIVADALDKAGIKGRRLEIEVVESLILDHTTDVLQQLEALKALGISIAMDDFGTGYSSLGYLWRFPFDKLKIDQSFMRALAAGQANVREIIATIITLGHHLRMRITAEGVETKEQADLLTSLGCDQIQGYYFGRPMPVERIEQEVLKGYGMDVKSMRLEQRDTSPSQLADVA